MSDGTSDKKQLDRRAFLQGAALVTGAVSLSVPASAEESVASALTPAPAKAAPNERLPTSLPAPEGGYLSFGPDEAIFVEALVNIMCPADELTPNGVDCGLAVYIDRQMAGGFGKGDRLYMHGPWKPGKPQYGYQLPLTPEQFFKAGVASANLASQGKFGRSFSELHPDEADAFLHDVAADKIEVGNFALGSWFNELVYPLFVQACFADPIYGGNVGKVFWRMIGYPGLPAVYADDMVEYRGKPHPLSTEPNAIADFS